MKISVIIPTYNEEKVIGECLASLTKQSHKSFEVIVVDDGSTDNSKFKIQNSKIQFKNQNLMLLEQKHKGPGMARNLGAARAKGGILVFVDADMTFDPNFLRNLVKPITAPQASHAGGQVKGTFSKEEYVANWDNVWARCWNVNSNLPPKRRLPLNYPDHQKVFRAILKSEFDRVGGFSKGGYTDDWTLSEKLGYEALSAGAAVFYHRNPDTLSEVYKQARWIAKRKYKLWLVGLVRASLLISVIIGIYKAIKIYDLRFMIFKIVYDLGIFVGILEMVITGKLAK